MKNTYREWLYLLFAGAVLLGASCAKELDIPSESSIDANAEITDEVANYLVVGIYESVMVPSDQNYFNVMMPDILANDDLYPVKFQWFQVEGMYYHTTPANDILLNRFYAAYYTGIYRCNQVLKAKVSDATKAIVRYCRAYSYYRLYQLYRSVPIVKEDTKSEDKVALSSADEVLNFIIEDLKFAADKAPAFTKSNEGSKEAAMALLARIYRLKKNLPEAAKWAEKVIASGKFKLASNPSKLDSEYIFCLNGTEADTDGGWGWICSEDAVSWNCFAASQSLIALVKPGDKRSVFFVPSTIGVTYTDGSTAYFQNKYTTLEDADLIVSRIAEMYLISAEAGNTARWDALKAARNSQCTTLKDERRLEMCFEWLSWDEKIIAGEKYTFPYPEKAVENNPNLNVKKK